MKQNAPVERRVYSTIEVAKILFCSKRSVQRYAREGLIPKPILPGRWSKAEIDDFLERQIATTCDNPEKDN